MVTDEMIRVALLAFQSGDMDWSSQDEELMRFALEEALSAMPQPKPVTHLVWLQGRRASDDVEDYYEVARPGDKCVDGSDPFPVYMHPPSLSAQVQDVAVDALDWSGFKGVQINKDWTPDDQELIYTALGVYDGDGDMDDDAREQIIERLLAAWRRSTSPASKNGDAE